MSIYSNSIGRFQRAVGCRGGVLGLALGLPLWAQMASAVTICVGSCVDPGSVDPGVGGVILPPGGSITPVLIGGGGGISGGTLTLVNPIVTPTINAILMPYAVFSKAANYSLMSNATQRMRLRQLATGWTAPEAGGLLARIPDEGILVADAATVSDIAPAFSSAMASSSSQDRIWVLPADTHRNWRDRGFESDGTGVTVGGSKRIDAAWAAGASLSVSREQTTTIDGFTRSHGESWGGHLYLEWREGAWRNMTIVGAEFRDETTRRLGITGTLDAEGTSHSTTLSAYDQISFDVPCSPSTTLQPFGALTLARTLTRHYVEQGPAALDVDAQSSNSRTVDLGVRIRYRPEASHWQVEGRVVRSHEFGDVSAETQARLVGLPVTIAWASPDLARKSVSIGAQVTGEISQGWDWFADANIEAREANRDRVFSGGIRYVW